MRSSSDRQGPFIRSRKPPAVPARLLTLLALGAAALTAGAAASAQALQSAPEPSSLCGRDSALEIVRQQIDAAKTFDDPVQRIAVTIRAADLLWPYRQEDARAAFSEAFELAAKDFKLKGDELKKSGRALLVETPDQRYVVVRAVAKRDPAWARRLMEELLDEDKQQAELAAAKSSQSDVRTAWKLLDTAAASAGRVRGRGAGPEQPHELAHAGDPRQNLAAESGRRFIAGEDVRRTGGGGVRTA